MDIKPYERYKTDIAPEEEKKKHEPKRVQELAGGGIASGIRRFNRGGKV